MFKILVALCKTAYILWNFDKHFSLRKSRQLLCLVFIHVYPAKFVNKGFEIMDMKKCSVIPLNMHVLDLRKYNAGFYTNIFLLKNHKHERPKDVW